MCRQGFRMRRGRDRGAKQWGSCSGPGAAGTYARQGVKVKESRTARPQRRWFRPIAGVLIAGLLATQSPVAAAQPAGGDPGIRAEDAQGVLQDLIREVSEREREVSDLELEMGGYREDVNRAFVDLERAEQEAADADAAVTDARGTLGDTRDELREAQLEFDEIARAAARQGSSGSTAFQGADSNRRALDRATALRRSADRQADIVAALDQARTEAANAESTLREARRIAEEAAGFAAQQLSEADRIFREAQATLDDRRGAYDDAINERDLAIAALDAARAAVEAYQDSAGSSRNPAEEDRVAEEAAEEAREAGVPSTESGTESGTDSGTDSGEAQGPTTESGTTGPGTTTEPSAPSAPDAPATGDASDNPTVGGGTGSGSGAGAGEDATDPSESTGGTDGANDANDNATTVTTAPTTNPETGQEEESDDREARIDGVINRAMGVLGTPYAWGGGSANGPTRGIRDGGVADRHGDYNKVGFDCSGLTLYAYAAAGVTLPHYTGYQYQAGTHYPASQMERGDLIFYGPNGHGHVAIYIGNGQMIESPQSGDVVKISPVRYNGMTPNVVRLL